MRARHRSPPFTSRHAAPRDVGLVQRPANKTMLRELCAALIKRRVHVRTAESCTGGGIANAITNVDGSSKIIDFCMAAYSPEVKQKVLGCHPSITTTETIVSSATSRAMARGLSNHCLKHLCLKNAPGEKYVYVGITGWIGWAPTEDMKNTAFLTVKCGRKEQTHKLQTRLATADKEANKRVLLQMVLEAITRVSK